LITTDAFARYDVVRRDVVEVWRMHARLGWGPGLAEEQTADPKSLAEAMGSLPERDLESDWDPRPRTFRLDGPHIDDPRLSFLIAALDFLTRRDAADGVVLVSTGTTGPSYTPALAVLAGAFPGLTWLVYGASAGDLGDLGSLGSLGAIYSSAVGLSSHAHATPKDVASAVGSAGGRPVYVLVDHRGDVTHRPDGARSKLAFAPNEEALAHLKATQDVLYATACEAAAAAGASPPAALMWSRLPYVNPPSVPSRTPRRFACFAGKFRRAYWGEYGASETWLEPAGPKLVEVDPADIEAVESDRWIRHPAMHYAPALEAALGEAEGAALPGFDSCANCAASLAFFAHYATTRSPLLPAAELAALPLRARAERHMSVALRALGRDTLVRVPPARVAATDPKPCVHGLVPETALVAGRFGDVVATHGAPLSAVEQAASHAAAKSRGRRR